MAPADLQCQKAIEGLQRYLPLSKYGAFYVVLNARLNSNTPQKEPLKSLYTVRGQAFDHWGDFCGTKSIDTKTRHRKTLSTIKYRQTNRRCFSRCCSRCSQGFSRFSLAFLRFVRQIIFLYNYSKFDNSRDDTRSYNGASMFGSGFEPTQMLVRTLILRLNQHRCMVHDLNQHRCSARLFAKTRLI